ncbi:Spherulation-specific family 4 [Mycena alexandri]|uniref:Spherulation-specific family 4 n=1 Tax=Mycena alexandri TaxID=1745969 RepID=A0AAD6SRD7_9AGAR|nr:Spherulation-specific family 4 [Mycena alexandri]
MFSVLFLFVALTSRLHEVTALLSHGVLFPLYIFPDLVSGDNCAAWTPVFNAITANPTLPFLFVVNPANGPGAANTQPDPVYQQCIPTLKSNANARVIGYVATGQGTRNSADVTADIATYAQWGAAYRPTGIFFDETKATTQFVSLYQSYASAVHSSALGSSAFIIFNPGVTPTPEFYTFADLIVTREDFYSSFSVSQLAINSTAPAIKQAVLLHDGPTTTPVSLVDQLIGQLGIGYLFITNAEYTSIPSDWDNFVADVSAAQS